MQSRFVLNSVGSPDISGTCKLWFEIVDHPENQLTIFTLNQCVCLGMKSEAAEPYRTRIGQQFMIGLGEAQPVAAPDQTTDPARGSDDNSSQDQK